METRRRRPKLWRIRAPESKRFWRPGSLGLVFILLGALGDPLRAEPAPYSPAAPIAPLPDETNEGLRVMAVSEAFAMTFPGEGWFSVLPSSDAEFKGLDLAVYHRGGSAWVKARLARRSNRGVEGSLIDEATEAKYLIQYDPATVRTKISLETYSGSALYCGRLRQGTARKACSLVAVALHGRKMIRLHSLVDAKTPRQREVLLAQVEAAFASLQRFEIAPSGTEKVPAR
jgi:hypothetical protein